MSLAEIAKQIFDNRFTVWQTRVGRIFSSLIWSAVIVATSLSITKSLPQFFEEGPISLYVFVFSISLVVNWLVHERNYFPKVSKKANGFLLLLGVSEGERSDDEINFRNDVIENLSNTFSKYDENIQVIYPCLGQTQKEIEAITKNKNRITELKKVSRAEFICHGRVKVRNDKGKRAYVFSPLPEVHHDLPKILKNKNYPASQISYLESTISSLFKERIWQFEENDQLLGVEITKSNLEISASYLLGVQLLVQGDFSKAERILRKVIENNQFKEKYNSETIQVVKYNYASAACFMAIEADAQGFDIDNQNRVIEILENIIYKHHCGFFFVYLGLARSYFLVGRIDESKQLYEKLHRMPDKSLDSIRVGRAFFHMWEKRYKDADKIYDILEKSNFFSVAVKDNSYQSIYAFIEHFRKGYNRPDLDYFLGRITYLAKDYSSSKTHFERFLSTSDKSLPPKFLYKAKNHLKEIKEKVNTPKIL